MNASILIPILPEIILSAGILTILLLDLAISSSKKRTFLFLASLIAVVGAGVLLLSLPYGRSGGIAGFVDDPWRRSLALILVLGYLYTLFLSDTYLKKFHLPQGEFYLLLMTTLLGMLFLISTTHLGYLFIGFETMSLPLYALCALRFQDPRSGEAGLKYFVLGSVASAFLLVGISLLYLLTGSLDLSALKTLPNGGIAFLFWSFLLIGLTFKLALVPFHFWSPDAYEGAPLPVTAWMSTGVKVAIAGILGRIWIHTHPSSMVQGFALLLILTVVVGNLLALRQENLKRFLAYSSIAHAGYIGIGLIQPTVDGLAAVLFYLVVYTVTNMGAFAVLLAESRMGEEGENLETMRGLGTKDGFLAFAFSLMLLSLAGIPPLGGFTAKLFLFSSAIAGGVLPLVVIAILSSLVGVAYYLRPIFAMFFEEGPPLRRGEEEGVLSFLLVLSSFLLFYFGLFPGSLLSYFREVATQLLEHGQ